MSDIRFWFRRGIARTLITLLTVAQLVLVLPAQLAYASPATHVVVSELQTAGVSATDEFVELYNPTAAPVDISGWKLQYKSDTGVSYSTKLTISAGKSIPGPWSASSTAAALPAGSPKQRRAIRPQSTAERAQSTHWATRATIRSEPKSA